VLKLVFCLRRLPQLSRAEFQRYWRETHGPIAGAIPGLRRYVQCHVLPELYARQSPPYDGAAELWFDDLDAMRAAMQSPELKAALEDEKNFINHNRVASFVTVEKPVVG
jgi:uncharacterized protein (TIGR02118 family)